MSKNSLCFLLFVLSACSWNSATAADQPAYDAQGKRNPFIPLVTSDGRLQMIEDTAQASKDTELVVDGIMFDKYGVSYALVNGDVVKVGDSVGEYRVLSIEPRKVAFIKEGQVKEVPFEKEGK
jgi:hypothetical protein